MIAVQKVTNVAFSVHDGMAKSDNDDETLTLEQKRYAVRYEIIYFFYQIFITWQKIINNDLY
jgi:hypothetical protein